MQNRELFIGEILRAGLWISILVVLIGGVFYLIQHGQELINYSIFQQNPHMIKYEILNFSSIGVIQFGLFILVLTQILRVALTVWMFAREKDYVFVWISLFILGIMIYSIFWRN